MLSVGRVSRTRERFFVFSRTVHAPLFFATCYDCHKRLTVRGTTYVGGAA